MACIANIPAAKAANNGTDFSSKLLFAHIIDFATNAKDINQKIALSHIGKNPSGMCIVSPFWYYSVALTSYLIFIILFKLFHQKIVKNNLNFCKIISYNNIIPYLVVVRLSISSCSPLQKCIKIELLYEKDFKEKFNAKGSLME
jgi:hypothetical protein